MNYKKLVLFLSISLVIVIGGIYALNNTEKTAFMIPDTAIWGTQVPPQERPNEIASYKKSQRQYNQYYDRSRADRWQNQIYNSENQYYDVAPQQQAVQTCPCQK